MPGPDATTAAELETMTPAERHADFESRIVTDLSQLPAQFQDRVRVRLENRLTDQGARREQ